MSRRSRDTGTAAAAAQKAQAVAAALLPHLKPGTRGIVQLDNGWSSAVTVFPGGDSFDLEHPQVFEHILDEFTSGGRRAVILRVFENETCERIQHRGRLVNIPYKTVYGWMIADGLAIPLNGTELREAYSTDARTGEPIAPEPDVRYGNAWPLTLERITR